MRSPLTWLLAVAVSAFGTWTLAAAVEKTVRMLPGEHWWGGAAAFGTSMPFDEGTDLVLDLGRSNYDNASAPFLVSDRGRSVLCLAPPCFRIAHGEIAVTCPDGEILLDESARTLREAFVRRAKNVMESNESGDRMGEEIKTRIDHWVSEATQAGRTLGYERKSRQGEIVPLLQRPGLKAWEITTVPTSMREVESSVRLVMDKRKLSPGEQKCAPWQHQKSGSENGEEGE